MGNSCGARLGAVRRTVALRIAAAGCLGLRGLLVFPGEDSRVRGNDGGGGGGWRLRERRWRPYTGWVSVALQSLTAIGAGHILSRSAVAQSVERSAVNRLVVGSNPTRGANSFKVRDSGLFCAWSCSAAFRRVWRNGPGRFRLVLCMELVRRVPACCGGGGRGDSGLFCAWSWSAAFRRVWRKGPGRFRLVLCMELVRRVPAFVAEGDGAIPARFVHGVGPPRSGVCGGRGRGDSGSFCAWSWSAAFRRVWRKGTGRFRLVLCMELVRRGDSGSGVRRVVAEGAGAIPACFVHGVGLPRSGVCGGRGRGDSGSFCAWSWSAAFRRLWRNGPGRFHSSWPTR